MHKKFCVFFFLFFFLTVVVFACEKKNYNFIVDDDFYIVKIPIQTVKITPYVSDGLETVFDIAQKTQAKIVINAGFFDAKNQKTVSYVFKDKKIVANPVKNENLINNDELKPYLDKIFNRGEFRVLNCNSQKVVDIALHNDEIKKGCELIHSIQAGPIILPKMNLEKEFFVVKNAQGEIIRDGAGMMRRTSRSLIAQKDDFIYLLITKQEKLLTIIEVQDKISKYNFEKVLGFDGGGSVSLFVKQNNGYFYQSREKNNTSRAVKSALLIDF